MTVIKFIMCWVLVSLTIISPELGFIAIVAYAIWWYMKSDNPGKDTPSDEQFKYVYPTTRNISEASGHDKEQKLR